MAKRPLTPDELQQHLEEQLQFLEASSAAFDAGFEGEAKRLAVTLRVLLHDTKNSHSLLGLVDKKDVRFFDTSFDFDPSNILSYGGLVFIAAGPPRTRYVAMLDDVPSHRFLDFDTWWNAPVFIDENRRSLTRRDLIRTAADQDGGAHVDPALDEVYADLARENSLGWYTFDSGQAQPMGGPERAAIRQIAHEVLKTLKPGYAKKPQHDASIIIGGFSLVAGPAPSMPSSQRPVRSGKIGRNQPCSCGSGRKYKRCCGAPL